MSRILVTPRSLTTGGHPALDRLAAAGHTVVLGPAGRQPEVDELKVLLADCEGYLAGVEPVPADVFAAAPRLHVISRNGVGVDNIDLAAAARRGVRVLRAEGANARGVAELALALLLALARAIPASDAALKAGRWERTGGVELEGRTLGLIGCGRVGREVARLAQAFGMAVVAFDPRPVPAPGVRFVARDEALGAADFLSLHRPPDPGGRPLLDAGALARLRHGIRILNTARADLVDETALLAALERGHVAGYATDVFRREPPGLDALLRHPRVIATPHIGGFTDASVDRAVHAAVDHLLAALAGPRDGDRSSVNLDPPQSP